MKPEQYTEMSQHAVQDDIFHVMLIQRADADASKRIMDKQKRFGQLTDIEQDLVDRAEVARKNRDELVRLMRVHGLLINAKQFPNWRPTQRILGDIPGIADGVTIIATDGLLAYFEHTEGVLIGHIDKFTGDVKPLFSVQKPKTDKPKTRRIGKSKRQKLLETL